MSDPLLADKAEEPKVDQVEPTEPTEPKADEPTEPKADEPKADEPKAEEPKVDEPEANPLHGAPESYDDLSIPKGLPDGFELDSQVVGQLYEVARDLNLSQDGVQALVDKVWPAMQERTTAMETEVHNRWVEEVKNDPDIGGSNLEENLATAKLAIEAYGDDGLKELLNGPLGSHPGIARFLVKVGRTVAEDKLVSGPGADPDGDAAIAAKMYPNSP